MLDDFQEMKSQKETLDIISKNLIYVDHVISFFTQSTLLAKDVISVMPYSNPGALIQWKAVLEEAQKQATKFKLYREDLVKSYNGLQEDKN